MSQATDPLAPARAYDRYLGPAIFGPWGQDLVARAAPQNGERAIDLACGTGIVSRLLAAELGTDGHLLAVDISEDMLAVASEKPPVAGAPIQWEHGSADAIPSKTASANLLVCQQGFQFFPDKAKASAEIVRVLKPGGRAIVSVWQRLEVFPAFRAIFAAESEYLNVPLEQLAVPFTYGSPETLAHHLRDAGFAGVEVTSHEREARFEDPDRFLDLVVLAGAAVVPDLALDQEEDRQALLAHVRLAADAALARFRQGSQMIFPMRANIARAIR